jgi:hypothetical protein
VIQDLELAPRNAHGKVEYAMDVYILTPQDPARGNGTILYDVANRGDKGALGFLNFGAVGAATSRPPPAMVSCRARATSSRGAAGKPTSPPAGAG